MANSSTNYDSPWKTIIERYFQDFMAFFFPQAHDAIAWQEGYAFLDKELQQIVREAEIGSRRVDKLVQVTPQGSPQTAWVLIHVEIQGQQDSNFAERMYIYNYRLYDRYQRHAASMAILSDTHANWRPHSFSYELFDCRVSLDFPLIKLLDYEDSWDSLEAEPNPFAIVVMAHLQTQRTQQQPSDRFGAKLKLAKMLYQRGYNRQDILELFRFIDWLLTLPPELEEQFQVELAQFEAEVKMEYVTSIERMAMEKGERTGKQAGQQTAVREMLLDLLQIRFGTLSAELVAQLNQIEDVDRLKTLHREAVTVPSLDTFAQLVSNG